jgi:SAM-dependent methyltransferase
MQGVPRLRPLAKGLASFVVPQLRTSHGYDNPLGTGSAESCYSIFLRHLCLIQGEGVRGVPKVVAELGPGSSLGVGLAALIAGAGKYYALDLIDHSDVEANLSVFDQLVEMFRNRTPIPASGVHSLRFPDLDDYAYPEFLTTEDTSSFDQRVGAIRRDIRSAGGQFVKIAAPWTEAAVVKRHSVDWVFSQSVLEHIDDLEGVYCALGQWLKPTGHMSHLIDFDSHGKAREWNGHWAVSDLAWTAMRGRRPYLINRVPYAEYVRLAEVNGFATVFEKRNKRFDGLLPEQFAPRYRSIDDEDARLRMVLVVSRRAGDS